MKAFDITQAEEIAVEVTRTQTVNLAVKFEPEHIGDHVNWAIIINGHRVGTAFETRWGNASKPAYVLSIHTRVININSQYNWAWTSERGYNLTNGHVVESLSAVHNTIKYAMQDVPKDQTHGI